MYSEAKKLHLIEEVLKINSEATLTALENFLQSTNNTTSQISDSNRFNKFSGIWSKDEAEEIEKNIAKSCDTIDINEWKYRDN